MQNPKILTTSILALGLFFLSVRSASAQTTDFALIVSPAQSYLKILPGNRATHVITLENNGQSILEITPKVLDFSTDGKTGMPVLLGKTEFSYLTMTDALYQTITLAPHAKAQLTLSFNVPAGAKNKEYPLSVVFSANKPGSTELSAGGSAISGSLVSNLVVLVSDESTLTKKITLEKFGAPKIVDSFDKITFAPILKNEAYAATIASGSASLYNWSGKKVAEFPVYPDSILGFSTREVRSYDENNLAKLFSYDSPFLFGPYKLELTIDNSVETVEALETTQTTIIALPISVLAVAILGSLAFLIYIKVSSMIVKKVM